MPPSKKIFLGASAIITGVLGQIILAHLLTQELFSTATNPGGGSAAGEAVDQRLEWLQDQMSIGLNAVTISYLFIVTGVLVLLVGIYQNARATERLQSNLPRSSQ